MPKKVPFSEHEAVLLLDAYLKTLSGEMERMESVRECSTQLRQMAINAGTEIDDTYRNVRGIWFQVASMESTYQGYTIMKPATRLFTEIVLLYRNNTARYQELLKEAKGMASTKKDNEAVQFANQKIAEAKTQETVQASMTENVRNLENTSEPDEGGNALMGDNAPTEEAVPAETMQKTEQSAAATAVNFHRIDSMAFSKPVSLSYFGKVKPEVSWKGLYVDVCKFLLEDYPDIFNRLKEESVHGSGKTWIVDEGHLNLLAAPKKLEDGLYVETQRNASALVKNLKWLLDECSVDYENVVITYTGKEKRKKAPISEALQDKENFYRWLQDDQHISENTCHSYVSAISSAERFAEKHGLTSYELYTSTPAVAKATADALFANPEFIQHNDDQHNRFRSAITKLLAFYGSSWSPTGTDPRLSAPHPVKSLEVSIDLTPYTTILVEHFPKGYRLKSTVDMKRFRRYYEVLTGTALDLDQTRVETAIRDCGIVYDGKLYMPENMLSEVMKDQIISFIGRCFEKGKSVVYYKAVFRKFSNELLDHNIYNAEMLKAYLDHYVSDRYYVGRSYLSTEVHANVDPIDEVRQCLKQYDSPVQVAELCDSLSHIADDCVRSILGSNSEFVRNGKGEYFHADSLDLIEEEFENIAAIIDSAIKEHEFISGNELYNAIQIKYPYTFEKNAAFSVIGWRDALKYKFADRFSFVGNIISKAGTSLSMSDVFAEYGKGRQRFSLDELDEFAESIGTKIYFDSLYTSAARISHQWFVDKESVRFSVLETDEVLDRFCDGNYMPISAVKVFAVFPDASFPWTEYLLEQYVAFFSEKFYLMHGNYNRNCAVGAIVRKTCHFDSFDELVTDILAHSNIPLRKKEVLNYLTENGYIARRSYTNIETLMINARARRNQKENN